MICFPGIRGRCIVLGGQTQPNQCSVWCLDRRSKTLGLPRGYIHRFSRHQAPFASWNFTISKVECIELDLLNKFQIPTFKSNQQTVREIWTRIVQITSPSSKLPHHPHLITWPSSTILLFQCLHRVSGVDEESYEISSRHWRSQHFERAATAWTTCWSAEQDTEGAGRIPGARESVVPEVRFSHFNKSILMLMHQRRTMISESCVADQLQSSVSTWLIFSWI